MPKKTAYSRSGAQRNKTKQKSFEVVRPASDDNVLETIESSEEEEIEGDGSIEVQSTQDEEEVEEVKAKAVKGAGVKVATAAAVSVAPAVANSSPRSAAARMAARREASQKASRSSSNTVTVEHYGYVRKDLVFILILAIIMFSIIITLHFVLGN